MDDSVKPDFQNSMHADRELDLFFWRFLDRGNVKLGLGHVAW